MDTAPEATPAGLLFRWRGVLSYDGSGFQGWQRQPSDRPTIQGVLEAALGQLAGHPVPTIGASRTDTGVHAFGQVCHATTSRWRPAEWWQERLNFMLPPAVRCREWTAEPWEFHARHRALGKTYAYDLAWGPEVLVFPGGLAPWWRRQRLDPELLAWGLSLYRTQLDWASFTSEANPPERPLTGCWLVQHPGRARILVQGPGFHYQQVRRMALGLVELATGARSPAQFEALLTDPVRNAMEQPAPPGGLVLVAVHYAANELGHLPSESLVGWWSTCRDCEVKEL